MVQEDCFWFLKGDGDDAQMAALCVDCGRKFGGWYWRGTVFGYGNYDLACDRCQQAIHTRDTHGDQNEQENNQETAPSI